MFLRDSRRVHRGHEWDLSPGMVDAFHGARLRYGWGYSPSFTAAGLQQSHEWLCTSPKRVRWLAWRNLANHPIKDFSYRKN